MQRNILMFPQNEIGKQKERIEGILAENTTFGRKMSNLVLDRISFLRENTDSKPFHISQENWEATLDAIQFSFEYIDGFHPHSMIGFDCQEEAEMFFQKIKRGMTCFAEYYFFLDPQFT